MQCMEQKSVHFTKWRRYIKEDGGMRLRWAVPGTQQEVEKGERNRARKQFGAPYASMKTSS